MLHRQLKSSFLWNEEKDNKLVLDWAWIRKGTVPLTLGRLRLTSPPLSCHAGTGLALMRTTALP